MTSDVGAEVVVLVVKTEAEDGGRAGRASEVGGA